jgi:hypothetical protein
MQVHEVHELHIINPDPRYGRVTLIEPTTLGYILLAAEIQPRPVPFVPNSRNKTALLARLKEIAQQLEQRDLVEKITVFDAIAFAPTSTYVRERVDASHIARFDVVVLIETRSPSATHDVQAMPAYQALVDTLSSKAKRVHIVAARNAKRIGDVDKTRKGTFLFNFLVGDDPNVVLNLWDYLAGWYARETGLDNSTVLVPLEGERSDYVAINNARWDGSLLDVLRQQITKPSFRTFMLANLESNHVGAMPIIYRLVDQGERAGTRAVTLALSGTLLAGVVALGVGLAMRRRRHV